MSGIAITLPVLWGDMDAMGHVNNVRFLRWFEEARIKLLDHLGCRNLMPNTVGPILATATCDYKAPVHYPANVEIRVKVTRVGESSITMEYDVEDADRRGTLYATGSSVVVLIDYATMEKIRVPDAVRTMASLP